MRTSTAAHDGRDFGAVLLVELSRCLAARVRFRYACVTEEKNLREDTRQAIVTD
jgi:hypothetical protein